MKTVWFEDKLTSQSKEYVLASEAKAEIAALRERQRVLVEAANKLEGLIVSLRYFGHQELRKLTSELSSVIINQRLGVSSAALAVKEG